MHTSATHPVRLGTRGSLLALAQSTLVAEALAARLGTPVRRHVITTSGDRKQQLPDARVSDKREWVDALEQALIRGEIDLALHSGKDVPVDVLGGTELVPVLVRESPFDLFLGRHDGSRRRRLAELAPGSTLGTASARRGAQLQRLGFAVQPLRGNVPTRLRRLAEREALGGIVLAQAGLRRIQATTLQALKLDEVEGLVPEKQAALRGQLAEFHALELAEAEPFAPSQLLPAMNQGILAAQVRSDKLEVRAALTELTDPASAAAFWAERAAVALLGADCESAAAFFAQPLEGGGLRLTGRVLGPGGQRCLEEAREGSEPFALGTTVADALEAAGAQELLHLVRKQG